MKQGYLAGTRFMKERGFIYLSGGGDEHKTAKIDSFFLSKLPSKRILFIPIGKTADRNGYKKSSIWLSNKLNKLSREPVEVSMVIDLGKCPTLGKFSSVYIGGGNTYKLLYLMKRDGFPPILKSYIRSGGIVYGASAGAVLMGVDISTYIEEKYLSDNEKHHYKLTDGMALVGNYSILTHFQGSDFQKVEKYFERKNNPVMAIPSGTAVMVRGKNAEIIGTDDVHIFHKGQAPKKISPSCSFVL